MTARNATETRLMTEGAAGDIGLRESRVGQQNH